MFQIFRNINRAIFIIVILAFLGTFFYLTKLNDRGNSGLLEEKVVKGMVSSKPIFFNDQVLLQLNKNIFIPFKIYKFEKPPEYRDFLEVKGLIRKVTASEKFFLHSLGLKANITHTIEDISSIKNDEFAVDNWFFIIIKSFRNRIFKVIYPDETIKKHKSEVAFLRGIFFGDFSELGIIYKTEKNHNNPLFLFIHSHFYIWFLLILSFLLAGSLSLKRKFIYIFSIIFIIFLNALHLFSLDILAPSIIVILFLVFATRFSIEKSIIYAINLGCFINLLIDPYIFTNKWFIYFISFSFVFLCLFRRFNNLFSEFLRGWKLWGCFCVLLVLPLFGFFHFILSVFYIFFVVVFFWIYLMVILQKVYPIINLNYQDSPKFIKFSISSWFVIVCFSIFPLGIFYSNQVDISVLFLFAPAILLLVIVFQLSFIGLFLSLFLLFLFPAQSLTFVKGFNVFSIISIDILEKYLMVIIMYFKEGINILMPTSFYCIPAYFLILFLVYLYLKRIKILQIRRLKKTLIFLVLCLFTIFIYKIAKQPIVKIEIFNNDYANFIAISLPQNEKILLINLFNSGENSLTKRIDSKYANRYFFSKNGLAKADYIFLVGEGHKGTLQDIFNGRVMVDNFINQEQLFKKEYGSHFLLLEVIDKKGVFKLTYDSDIVYFSFDKKAGIYNYLGKNDYFIKKNINILGISMVFKTLKYNLKDSQYFKVTGGEIV
ncbi:MAG: hypothetical protein GY817_03905 [bacterium]|nr:hypothetical protein [bacterium]